MCSIDNSGQIYPDDPCNDVSWPFPWNGASVQAIADRYNTARASDPTVTVDLTIPFSQAEWDALTENEKGLFLLNEERVDRGIFPVSAVVAELVTVAQDHADYHTDYYTANGSVSLQHQPTVADWTASGRDASLDANSNGSVSPWERMNGQQRLDENTEFFSFGENLAWQSIQMEEPVAFSMYSWLYDDAGSAWGHRHFALAAYNNNAGDAAAEGLCGFGVSVSSAGTFTVMNAMDESASWQHPSWDSVRYDSAVIAGDGGDPISVPTVPPPRAREPDTEPAPTPTSAPTSGPGLGPGQAEPGVGAAGASAPGEEEGLDAWATAGLAAGGFMLLLIMCLGWAVMGRRRAPMQQAQGGKPAKGKVAVSIDTSKLGKTAGKAGERRGSWTDGGTPRTVAGTPGTLAGEMYHAWGGEDRVLAGEQGDDWNQVAIHPGAIARDEVMETFPQDRSFEAGGMNGLYKGPGQV